MEELKTLVLRARDGDLDAYGEMVRRFQDMACGYAYAMLGDFHLAEDAAQEAFLEAYRCLGDLREPAAFPGWFRRVVFKHCDRMRRGKRAATSPLTRAADVAAQAPDPGEAAVKAELRDTVLAAVRALPEPERTVTTLFYINGYSQSEIADFLEAPVSTVKNRLHGARSRLKGRMLAMVKTELKSSGADERFSQRVIDGLLARPRPLEIEGHPIRRVWEMVRGALPDYEVIEGEEIEERGALDAVMEDFYRTYHLDETRMLRTQMTVTTFKAMRGRRPPVRLLAAGRVFRPHAEDASHAKVFNQADGLCIEAGADLAGLKGTVERALRAIFGEVEVRWREFDFGFVAHGVEADARLNGQWIEVTGGGVLKAETLSEAGFDPKRVGGYAFGMGLDRLAMTKYGIGDIRELYRAPYVGA